MAYAQDYSSGVFVGLPCDEYLENVARRFPDLLLKLGAPDLEEGYEPATCRVAEESGSSSFEVVLQRRSAATAIPDSCQDPHLLQNLSQLAADYEQLALCAYVQGAVQAAASAAACAPEPIGAVAPPPVEAAPPRPPPPASAFPPAKSLAPAPAAGTGAAGSAGVAVAPPTAGPALPPRIATDTTGADLPAAPVASWPASSSPHSQLVRTRERQLDRDANDRSPNSARGERQVRQGGSDSGGSKILGRTRGQRQPLRIAITKVRQLEELGQPASPKHVVRRHKVWGAAKPRSASPAQERKAEAIKARIERKLRHMFSDISDAGGEVPGLQKRHSIQ
uniref:Uncharacterized protein n=1 Tax=Alexandrium monilatum TaxID=311494 RepID=A0A7S4V7R7_9DINO|mmetsp:Transcript_95279/g.293863  ORF Transcript_95279/g.293863 Transcript_95279/m.293863 type:complete len:336 (-) Transcript_95279:115-1122(-)